MSSLYPFFTSSSFAPLPQEICDDIATMYLTPPPVSDTTAPPPTNTTADLTHLGKMVTLTSDPSASGVEEVGEVVAYHPSTGLGLAVLKLDSIHQMDSAKSPVTFSITSNSDSISSESHRIIPFKPHWWPVLNSETGQV